MLTRYAVRRILDYYIMVKFSHDLEVLDVYYLEKTYSKRWICTCPDKRFPCKHFSLLKQFRLLLRVNSGMQYEPETDTWYPEIKLSWMEEWNV